MAVREWPDPIHRAYLTLKAQRSTYAAKSSALHTRRQMRAMARKIAYKGEKDGVEQAPSKAMQG